MEQKIVKILLELLKIKGHSREERPVADYILRFCRQHGVRAKEDNTARKTKGNAGNVLAWPAGVNPDNPRLMLVSHMDTVDVGPSPSGFLKGGKIVTDGRHPAGIDNRLGVALLLNLLSEVKGNYVCAFTTQEEIGMFGAEAMKIPSGVKEIAVLDGSQSPGHGVLSTCGGVTFNVKLTGLASHAGIAPNAGRSAILMASRAITKLKLGMPGREVSVNIGVIKGGTRSNVVPAGAEVIGEVRADSIKRMRSEINKVKAVFAREAAALRGKMTFTCKDMFLPYANTMKNPLVRRLAGAVKKAGLKPDFTHYRGGSDANVFNPRGRVSANLSIGAHNPHSEKEYTEIREIRQAWRIVRNLVEG